MHHLLCTEDGDKSQQQDLAEVPRANRVPGEKQPKRLQVSFKVENLFEPQDERMWKMPISGP